MEVVALICNTSNLEQLKDKPYAAHPLSTAAMYDWRWLSSTPTGKVSSAYSETTLSQSEHCLMRLHQNGHQDCEQKR